MAPDFNFSQVILAGQLFCITYAVLIGKELRTFWRYCFQAIIETWTWKLTQYVPSTWVNPCQSIKSNVTDEWNLLKYSCENCESSRMKVPDLTKSTKHICYNVPSELTRNANTKLSSFLIYTSPHIYYSPFIFTSLLYVLKVQRFRLSLTGCK